VENCFISSKVEGEELFLIEDGEIYPKLDGYAIIPIDNYKKLIQSETGTK
jgi:hypothetical protein